MTRRRALAGAAVLVLYVATTWFTRGLHPTNAPRVLFDGFAPQAPYRWVNPPSELRPGNQKPARAKGSGKLGPQGSEALSVATSDGQAFVSLSEGSIPPHDNDTSVEAVLTPLDPSTLGPLPGGMRFEGNAYHVDIRYRPSGAPVTTFAKPATVALTASGPATELYSSADGKTWALLPTRALGAQAGLSSAINAPGYVVTAGHGAPYKLGGKRGMGILSYAALAVLVLGTLAVVFLIVRRRPS
jgi:hypothetical protein